MIRILFQGDSITDGDRLKPVERRWDLNHQIGHSYVYPIVGKLSFEHPGKFTFINRGLSGDSAESIQSRWQTDTIDEKPDVLSLLLGVNGNGSFDGTYPEGTEEHLSKFERLYRLLLDQARLANPNLKIILLEPFILPCGILKNKYNSFFPVFQKKQAIIRQIAGDYNALFIPLQNDIEKLVTASELKLNENGYNSDPNLYWMWDGIHPTEQLHWFIAEKWLAAATDFINVNI